MRNAPSTKVMEIFSEAATHDAPQRAAFLESACAGDAELRADVESLLATQPHIGEFLDAPTPLSFEGAHIIEDDEAARHDADSIERGRSVVGRYSIVERIGEGGFGVVYCARQNHPMQREVALKIVKLGMDTRQIIARFELERQALALMDHPNIARIFDAGATADGRPYFVMELVRGLPITGYCDAQRLMVGQRLELFLQVCHAVQHAHQKGMIHRDLKPSNILVTQTDGAPFPKVIDFGIAKAMEQRPGEHTAYTELRHFLGTPEYMAPEQAGGGNGDVDTRSDIYSLGVLLYELLTGATPFDSQRLQQVSYYQVHRIIREEDPPKPSTRLTTLGPSLTEVAERRGLDPQKLPRTVAGELDWIVMKALEKDRSQRYETVSAFAEDVRRYLVHEPLVAGPPDTLYRLKKFTRRHRRPLLAAGAVALALLAGLTGTTVGFVRAQRDRDRANVALAQAEQISKFLSDMLRSANPDQAKGNPVLVRDVLDKTSSSIDAGALRDHPLVEAGIRMTLGGAYESLGLYPDSKAQFRSALTIRERELGEENRETAKAMVGLACECANLADNHTANSLAQRALAIQEKLLEPHHPEVIETLVRIGWILRSQDTAAAEATLRRALDLSRSSGQPVSASLLTNLGVLLMDKGDFDGAEPLLSEALTIDRQAHGDHFRNVPRNLSNLAVIRQERGDLSGAETYWTDALRLQREMLPQEHPDIAWTLRLLGKCKRAQGDLAEAETLIRHSIEMEKHIFGARHPLIAVFIQDLEAVLEQQGRRDECLQWRREGLAIRIEYEMQQIAARPDLAEHHGTLAELHIRRGEFHEALAELTEAGRLKPDEPQWWYLKAYLGRYLADESMARDGMEKLIQYWADTTDSDLARLAATAWLLAPAGEPVPPAIRKWLDRPAPRPLPATLAPHELCQGLAMLRRGQSAPAIEHLTRSRDLATDTMVRAAAECYLALALCRQGSAAQAQAALDRAQTQFEKIPRLEDGDIGADWQGWFVCQTARREAEGVVYPHAVTKKGID